MITKKVSPKGKSVRVTFELPGDVAADSIAIAGDFNEWNIEKDIMKLDAKKGVWKKGISFKPGDTLEFRYLVDGNEWRNDEAADRYVANPYWSENGVVEL